LWNPCLAKLPQRLADHDLVRAAWEGLDASRVWDSHAHLVGTGDSNSGIYVNPRTESLLNPGEYARRLFFLNAGCVHEEKGSVDRAYVERMHNLADGMKRGFKMLLLAFERAHDERGEPDLRNSMFYVPDAYTRDIARKHSEYFEWAASVHPYRGDALDALESAKKGGAVAVKWLPAAMNIDPASKRCDAFYEFLSQNKIPLIVHAGEERAVTGSEKHDYGNPLRLRRALRLDGRGPRPRQGRAGAVR
jgi:mannonate dehydratase